jgi:choline dehydrogenase-like flavoprotein
MGITNGNDPQYDGTTVETQVCVIGSGPAGITAAWHLLKDGVKNVTLIEGSRTDNLRASREDKKLLYNGKAEGLFTNNEPEFLLLPYPKARRPVASERERIYGGTSLHWAGQCRPLDPITFEGRPNFPAWPIKRTDLDEYYGKASTFLNLHGDYKKHGDNFSADYWAQQLDADVPKKLAGFEAEMYQFVGDTNFAAKLLDGKPIGETDVNVIKNATLRHIEHSDRVVKRLHVASMDESSSPKVKNEFFIHADAYVLACGAVANARQLLLSNAGNEYDQVGRFFMCHPIADVFTDWPDSDSYLDPREIKLMTTAYVGGVGGISSTGRFSPDADQQQRWGGIGGCWFDITSTGIYFEMAPNEDSRVTLDSSRDPVFDQPQTKIEWLFTGTDEKTYNHLTQLFKESVEKRAHERGRNAKVSFASWADVKNDWTVNGHHIGTTRMSEEAKDGVVDKNLKVHSLANLYVAGSSVFRTAGISNPTFTIVALSIRLAEHLSGLLKG